MCNEKQEQLSVVNSIFLLGIISTLKEIECRVNFHSELLVNLQL